jgi:DNA-binding LytR/AlgR family response regulator
MIRAVIVEDESLARQYLIELLLRTGKVQVVGEAGDVRAAAEHLEGDPDVVFLEIELPGGSGLALAARLLARPRPPLVVFTTAYRGHAVEAFRVEAVDYLLKPCDPDDVLRAVRRVEARLTARPERPAEEPAEIAGDRLPVRAGREAVVRLLPRTDVVAVVRRGRRTVVCTTAEEYPTHYPLAAVARWLGGEPFVQVARDAIVNMTAVAEIIHSGDRKYRLRLGTTRRMVVPVARSQAGYVSAYRKAAVGPV